MKGKSVEQLHKSSRSRRGWSRQASDPGASCGRGRSHPHEPRTTARPVHRMVRPIGKIDASSIWEAGRGV